MRGILKGALWRLFARRPGSVLLALLLVVLLAFGDHFCPTPAHAASLPAPAVGHDGCPEIPSPDNPAKSFPWFCGGGACLHSVGHHDANPLVSSASGWDQSPQPLLATALLSPDWANGAHSPAALTVSATGPPPPQRSRVLRL
ncbi:MAG: hypothetical protein WBQ93_03165 [Candidatus Competibacter sp.]